MNDLPVAVTKRAGLPVAAGASLPADRNPALVYLAGLSEGSRVTMRHALQAMAGIVGGPDADIVAFPWHMLRFQHTAAIRAALAERYSPATANRMLSALRGVLGAAWRLGLMTAEDHLRAVDVKGVKGSGPDAAETGRHIQAGELMALMAACSGDGTAAGIRDAAILAVGYSCGLRRAELAGLTVADFDTQAHTLTVRGKGGKVRVVYAENGALDALTDWLDIRGTADGPLFVAILKNDRLTDGGLTPTAVHLIVKKRAEQAGVKDFSPHDLRRTFAGDLLDAGADIATVQKMMGHASVSTTAGYDRRDSKAKKKAAALLFVPYQKRGG